LTHNGVVAGSRLTDWISLGVLASSVPRDAVDEGVAAAGKGARRSDGKLPPHVMVYFAMALALFVRGLRGGRGPADRDPGVVGVLTSPRNLNPARRHRSYPRVVRRARHNSYRVKRPRDTGTRYPGPPAIKLVNLPATAMVNLG